MTTSDFAVVFASAFRSDDSGDAPIVREERPHIVARTHVGLQFLIDYRSGKVSLRHIFGSLYVGGIGSALLNDGNWVASLRFKTPDNIEKALAGVQRAFNKAKTKQRSQAS